MNIFKNELDLLTHAHIYFHKFILLFSKDALNRIVTLDHKTSQNGPFLLNVICTSWDWINKHSIDVIC